MSTPQARGFFALARWALLGTVLCLTACGITAPRSSEGFAELDSPGVFDTDESVSLSIGPTLLHFAAANMDDDEEGGALLRDLDGVRIRVYEIENNSAGVAKRIDTMQARLLDAGWEPIILMREEGDVTHLLAKFSEDRILGLTLLAIEGADEESGEVVVINLMGEIQPQNFSQVMVALDVDKKSARDVQVAQVN